MFADIALATKQNGQMQEHVLIPRHIPDLDYRSCPAKLQ
jgi:hypothetical protein